MLRKKSVRNPTDIDLIRKQLEYLYSRRTALESLIRSLELYDRFRGQPIVAAEARSA